MTLIGDLGQRRGPIVDFPGAGPNGNAWCRCDHGKEWEEGALYERCGGPACEECSQASLAATHADCEA